MDRESTPIWGKNIPLDPKYAIHNFDLSPDVYIYRLSFS